MTENAIGWTLFFVALAHAVSSLEMLAARQLFEAGGRCSWSILRIKFKERSSRLLDPLFNATGFRVLLTLRLISALGLMFQIQPWLALCLLGLCAFLVNLRCRPLMVDSGDGFLLTVTLALVLTGPVSHPTVNSAVLFFIGAQACLSYFTAGLYKVWARWGNGDFLAGVIECQLLVDPDHAEVLKDRRWLLIVMEISVVAFQLSAPLIFVLGVPFAIVLILWSFSFHLLGSWGLGLRPFSFAYLTCYPALLWCAA